MKDPPVLGCTAVAERFAQTLSPNISVLFVLLPLPSYPRALPLDQKVKLDVKLEF